MERKGWSLFMAPEYQWHLKLISIKRLLLLDHPRRFMLHNYKCFSFYFFWSYLVQILTVPVNWSYEILVACLTQYELHFERVFCFYCRPRQLIRRHFMILCVSNTTCYNLPLMEPRAWKHQHQMFHCHNLCNLSISFMLFLLFCPNLLYTGMHLF